jgi:hypothetical protein
MHGGIVPLDNPSLTRNERNNLKQYVHELGDQLSALLQINGSPFRLPRGKRRFETHFRITSEGGVRFPTPAGLTWGKVSIAENRAGGITVSADAVEHSVTFVPSSEDRGGVWEGTEGSSVVRRHYDFRTLSLADANGRLRAAGEALLAVLRGGGKVQREQGDRAMLTLGRCLTDLMQIDSSPFQVSPAGKTWSALFEASDAVRDTRS